MNTECGVLRASIGATLVVSSLGIGFGLVSGSFSITFDGVYSLVDATMSLLALGVANLIATHAASRKLAGRLHERFSMGFWHLEPMVLALNGMLLVGIAIYALINAVGSLLEGGRDLEFGYAIIYAALTVAICTATAVVEARANRRIGSDFIALDVRGWVMSAGITAALLIAFCLGYAVEGTTFEWITPFIDPAVLAIVCLVIAPLPIATVRQALSDMFLVTPTDLKQEVDAAAQAFVARHGFSSYRAYVARVGRSRMIELYFIVPPGMATKPIAAWDALRDEMGEALGGEGPDRWLTIVFTGDPEWAE
ncbi:cation transporter [Xanthobacter sp. V4C-4]|uniref:cation diffusion facilitator family transporter n=1 Tax=Xanthobacter cornucopiae TaxID=3119924 RepID=UPI0037298AE8